MTNEESIEILEEIYGDLSLVDRLGKKGEAIVNAICALEGELSDD